MRTKIGYYLPPSPDHDLRSRRSGTGSGRADHRGGHTKAESMVRSGRRVPTLHRTPYTVHTNTATRLTAATRTASLRTCQVHMDRVYVHTLHTCIHTLHITYTHSFYHSFIYACKHPRTRTLLMTRDENICIRFSSWGESPSPIHETSHDNSHI